MEIKKLIKLERKKFIGLIVLVLFIIPFFWFKPGTIEMGGDSNRLYFYDPISYLLNLSFFSINPEAQREIVPNQHLIPFLLFIAFLKAIIRSPYILIAVNNGVKLAASFLIIYLILKELFDGQKEKKTLISSFDLAAIFGGLFYAFSPSNTENMSLALDIHNQVFLNPLSFYLMFKFLMTQKKYFLWFLLLSTIIFSPNFSPLVAAPPLLAFYPLAFLSLFFYIKFVQKKPVLWKTLVFFLILFLGLQAFQLLPATAHFFDPAGYIHERVFDRSREIEETTKYFYSMVPYGTLTLSYFYRSALNFKWFSFLPMLIIVLGLTVGFKNKSLNLFALFFLAALFMVSANISHISLIIYRSFYQIPGYGMFRNFVGQWQFVHSFFYALTFGLAMGAILVRLRKRNVILLSAIFALLFLFSNLKTIKGEIINVELTGTKGERKALQMDKNYEATIKYVKSLPGDGKFLCLPYSDFSTQVIHGVNNAAYVGPSPLAYLGGKNTFSGYNNLMPFSDVFKRLVKEKKYNDIKRLLSLLNIQYIFYNSDPKIYNDNFTSFPFGTARTYMPETQNDYQLFINQLTQNLIFEKGPYKLFKLDDSFSMPHLYIPTQIKVYTDDRNDWYGENKSFFVDDSSPVRTAFLKQSECDQKSGLEDYCQNQHDLNKDLPGLKYTRINPSLYLVNISNIKKPFILVFLDKFNGSWGLSKANINSFSGDLYKSYFSGQVQELINNKNFSFKEKLGFRLSAEIAQNSHFSINGYANGWYIKPVSDKKEITFVIEARPQRLVYIGIVISFIFLLIYFYIGMRIFQKRYN